VRPLHTGRYTLSAVTPGKDPDEAHVDVQVLPLKTPRLQAPSKPISFGESAVLTWQAEGTNGYTILSIQPDVGQVSGTSVEVRPSRTTDYRLVLTGADGQTVTSDPVTVQVLPAIQRFNVAPATLTDGEPVKIEWQAADADAVSIVRDDGFVVESNAPAAGSTRDRPPAAATSYTIKARNATGESLDNGPNTVFKIKVQPPPTPTPAPTQPPAAPAPPNGATTPNGGPTTPNGGPANNGGTAPPNPPSGPVPLLPPLRQT
jgi:hypothetical protein